MGFFFNVCVRTTKKNIYAAWWWGTGTLRWQSRCDCHGHSHTATIMVTLRLSRYTHIQKFFGSQITHTRSTTKQKHFVLRRNGSWIWVQKFQMKFHRPGSESGVLHANSRTSFENLSVHMHACLYACIHRAGCMPKSMTDKMHKNLLKDTLKYIHTYITYTYIDKRTKLNHIWNLGGKIPGTRLKCPGKRRNQISRNTQKYENRDIFPGSETRCLDHHDVTVGGLRK